jgi:predicted phage terminase large subunit-like protein
VQQNELQGTALTTNEQEQLKYAAHAALAREDYLAYATFIDPSYKVPPHLQLLGGYLNAVERGDIKKLAITMPPRHGKSETTSGKFPGWCLGRDQSRCIMLTSYGASLAETFSIQNRDTIASNPRWRVVFPDAVISPNVRGREKWALAGQRENVIAAGVGGAIVGFGAWLFIIDDPIKNYEEAISQARQDQLYNWYTTVARTRRTLNGRIIIIMTRWAENDLLGRVLEADDEYVVVHLPAISYGVEADYIRLYPDVHKRQKELATLPVTAFPDPLERPKGDVLWPELFDDVFMAEQAVALQHQFQAIYQGNPSAPEGTKFQRKWFRGITPLVLSHLKLTSLSHYRSYDLAWSEKQKSDFTAGLRATLYKVEPFSFEEEEQLPTDVRNYLRLVSIPPVILVLEDMQRWQKEWDQSSDEIIRIANTDTAKYQLLIEAVASQNVGVKSLQKDMRMWKHKIKGVTVKGDKEVRATYGLALASKGAIFILYPTPTTPPSWEKEFLNEHAAFPAGKNDDQIDAYTQLVNHLQPQIDRILNNYKGGEWITPFMGPGPGSFGKHLPSEFQQTPIPSRLTYDQLGWCV